MEQPVEMNTLSQILEKLRLKGKDNEIRMSDHGKMQSANLNKIYKPEDLTIVKTYRFEGMSILPIARYFILLKIKTRTLVTSWMLMEFIRIMPDLHLTIF